MVRPTYPRKALSVNPQPFAATLRRRAPTLLLAAVLCAALSGVALAESGYDSDCDRHVYSNGSATDKSRISRDQPKAVPNPRNPSATPRRMSTTICPS